MSQSLSSFPPFRYTLNSRLYSRANMNEGVMIAGKKLTIIVSEWIVREKVRVVVVFEAAKNTHFKYGQAWAMTTSK